MGTAFELIIRAFLNLMSDSDCPAKGDRMNIGTKRL